MNVAFDSGVVSGGRRDTLAQAMVPSAAAVICNQHKKRNVTDALREQRRASMQQAMSQDCATPDARTRKVPPRESRAPIGPCPSERSRLLAQRTRRTHSR